MNLHWPAAPGNGYVAWYVILFRSLFYPLFLLALGLGYAATFAMYGPRSASRWLRDAT